MIDNKGRLFGKINILDLFVVILIVVLALGTYYKFTSPKTSIAGGDSNIEFVLKVRQVSDFTEKYYEVGDTVYDTKTGQNLGVITNVETTVSKDVIETVQGEAVLAEVPHKIDVYLTVNAQGLETEKSYLIDGAYELKRGSGIALKTKNVQVSSFVYDIKVK